MILVKIFSVMACVLFVSLAGLNIRDAVLQPLPYYAERRRFAAILSLFIALLTVTPYINLYLFAVSVVGAVVTLIYDSMKANEW
jgi:hypothetical protein